MIWFIGIFLLTYIMFGWVVISSGQARRLLACFHAGDYLLPTWLRKVWLQHVKLRVRALGERVRIEFRFPWTGWVLYTDWEGKFKEEAVAVVMDIIARRDAFCSQTDEEDILFFE